MSHETTTLGLSKPEGQTKRCTLKVPNAKLVQERW